MSGQFEPHGVYWHHKNVAVNVINYSRRVINHRRASAAEGGGAERAGGGGSFSRGLGPVGSAVQEPVRDQLWTAGHGDTRGVRDYLSPTHTQESSESDGGQGRHRNGKRSTGPWES